MEKSYQTSHTPTELNYIKSRFGVVAGVFACLISTETAIMVRHVIRSLPYEAADKIPLGTFIFLCNVYKYRAVMRFGRLAKESNSFYLLFNNESEMSWKLFFLKKKYI